MGRFNSSPFAVFTSEFRLPYALVSKFYSFGRVQGASFSLKEPADFTPEVFDGFFFFGCRFPSFPPGASSESLFRVHSIIPGDIWSLMRPTPLLPPTTLVLLVLGIPRTIGTDVFWISIFPRAREDCSLHWIII